MDFYNKTERLETICMKKENGEFITKEHTGSSLDGKVQSSTYIVECLSKIGQCRDSGATKSNCS